MLGAMLILTACQMIPTIATGEAERVSCSVFRPITYSAKKDTERTVAEVREHNAAYLSVCP